MQTATGDETDLTPARGAGESGAPEDPLAGLLERPLRRRRVTTLTTPPPSAGRGIDATHWPPLPASRRPDPTVGLRSAPRHVLTPRISTALHGSLRYAFAVAAAEFDLPELAPSFGCEWLARIGLLHIDDPDLLRLVHVGDSLDLDQVLLAPGHSPAGENPAAGWADEVGTTTSGLYLRWPAELAPAIGTALRDWKAAHPVTVLACQGGSIARQGFIEGLLRLGLKHIADPDGEGLLRP